MKVTLSSDEVRYNKLLNKLFDYEWQIAALLAEGWVNVWGPLGNILWTVPLSHDGLIGWHGVSYHVYTVHGRLYWAIIRPFTDDKGKDLKKKRDYYLRPGEVVTLPNGCTFCAYETRAEAQRASHLKVLPKKPVT